MKLFHLKKNQHLFKEAPTDNNKNGPGGGL